MTKMTAKQIARLVEWLKLKGFALDQVVECLNYIAKAEEKKK